jgi:RimJ/RimL family protein N-acetyltransferase
VRLVCDWAERELGLTTLVIVVHEDNTPSIRVARSAGFTEAGERRVAPREGLPDGRYLVYHWHPG